MQANQDTQSVISFGPFEADLRTQEVRKRGIRIRLPGQSFQILKMLLERPGELVTREELRATLWPADTFVDFEHSVNAAIRRLREALGDSADDPHLIETLPRRGYRFIALVTRGDSSTIQPVAEILPANLKTWGSQRVYGLVILGALVATVGVLGFWKTVFRTPGPPRILRYRALTNDGQVKTGPLATDGSRIYFGEVLPGPRNRIVQVSIRGGESVPFALSLKQAELLDASTDGTELLLANNDGSEGRSVWLQPVAGGSPRRVGTILAVDARFAADETKVIYSNGQDVYTASLDGSSARKLLTAESVPFSFKFSPDQRVFRFTVFDYQRDDMKIMQAAVDGTELHKMFQGCCGKWTPDGRFFVFQNRPGMKFDLWAVPEGRKFPWSRRNDEPIPLTAGPVDFQDPLPSKDGKEIFAIGSSRRAEVIRYDSRSGQFVPYLAGISAEGLAFSRDGQWVAYTSYPDGALWRSKVDGSERVQLTFPPFRVLLPRWSPNGKQIAFNANLPDVVWNVYLVSSDGGTPQRILPSKEGQMDVNWSPDGGSLVFGSMNQPNTPIYTMDLKSNRVSALPGSSGFFSPRWSPDGRYLVAMTSDPHSKLMLFDSTTQEWTALGTQGSFMCWSRDGKTVYSQVWDNPVQHTGEHIVRFRLSDRKLENIVDVKDVGRLTTGSFADWFGLAPDDSPLFARDISTTEIYALEMDWR